MKETGSISNLPSSSHNNPVKKGLVSVPEDWEWSGVSWYNGKPDVKLARDDISSFRIEELRTNKFVRSALC